MDAKFELKQLILLNEIDERFYDYIIGLFYQFSDLTFEDINGICTEHLSPEGRHALTELICNLGDAKNIDNYLSYNSNFDEYDIELLSKRLYELNAKEVLTDILHYEKLEAYYDDIFDLLSNMDNTLYDDIKNIDISSLNSTNFLKYTKILLKSANEQEIVRFAITYQDALNNIITDFVNIVCKFNAPEYIYEFAYNITNISNDDMSKLVKRIIEINNIEYMYLFLKNISNISKKDRKNLKAKILESHEMKFILLVAVYIDVKLINKLFESKYKMYSFIVSSKLFDKNELGDISNELFLKKVYNKEKEDVNITKISNKTYKLIDQNNLKPNKNSKKNKKDSK
jgi:hypothetical protein